MKARRSPAGIHIIVMVAVSLLTAWSMSAVSESATVAEGQADSVFDVANEEYKAGNYENAIRLYEGLLSDPSLKAADIHYNKGNASYKLDSYGKSIAAYRRALRLAPRDQDIIANLRFVTEATLDKMDQPKSTEFLREVFFFHYALSAREAETIFVCSYFAAALLATTCIFHRARFLRWLAALALSLALIFGASTTLRRYRAANPNRAVVVAKEADLHTGPGNNYLVSLNIHDGAELTVRKSEGGWYQVELADGRRGWIRESLIEII